MTVEELMQPRYKVIGIGGYHYPGSRYKVGQIIGIDDGRQHYDAQNGFELYPHLFQPLPWWSDRKVEEMPEFISYISLGLMDKYNGDKSKAKIIIKIESWSVCEENGKWFFNDNEFNTIHHYHFPATLADYEAFISTTKK